VIYNNLYYYEGSVYYSNVQTYAYLYSDGDEIFQHPYGYFRYVSETSFLIYEYMENDVETESDITAVKGLEESTLEEAEEERTEKKSKPDCAKFVEITGAKTIETTFDEKHTLDGARLTAKSDPASSLIEDELCVDDSKSDLDALYKNQKDNDGRLLTDKSVIYGADDYEAIDVSDYESGDFSVALSALGQEWAMENDEDKTPIDVVLIFDVSNSMTLTVSDKDSTPKWQASVDAINDVSKELFAANEKNRVGIVAFSNAAMEILPIGRYSSDDGDIFTYTSGNNKTLKISDTLYDGTDPDTRTASSYRGEALFNANAYGTDSNGLWSATFTQEGIQKSYELFKDVTDTTVYYPSIDKEYIRQPVTILLTDGDPTFCTYNYMDPKGGPYYGTGLSNGIEGYYTVLSANYFKNMISLHYKRNSVFYTIGMGIKPSGYGTYYEEGEFSLDRFVIEPDNSYMRAVLDPTEENINALVDYSRYWEKNYREGMENAEYFQLGAQLSANVYKTTGPVFKQLITGKDENGNDVDVGSLYGYTCYAYYSDKVAYDVSYATGQGDTEDKIMGVDNPYKDDYDYVDEAYFGQLGRDDLDSIFERILENIQLKPKYAYILKEGTNVVITDPIGSGMTVKGEPVLRYFGTNYSVTDKENGEDENSTYTDYYWKKTVTRVEQSDAKADDMDIDLSTVVARVSVDKTTGDQTVTLSVPETALPVFYPDLNRNFYYEELPVRLIYRVGLSEAEEQKLEDEYKKKKNVSATYYTNKYSDGVAATVVKFTPETSDPYYKDMTDTITYQKETNTTDTVAYNFSESYNADTGEVTQLLGNNGVLQVEKGEVLDIKVKKEWESTDAKHPDKVNVALYVKGTVTDADGNKTSFARICDLVEISADTNWEYTWKKLKREEIDDDGNTYSYDIYYVGELEMDGYSAVYKNADDVILDNNYKKFDFSSDMAKYVYSSDYGFHYTYISWNDSLDDDSSDSADDEYEEEEEEEMQVYSVDEDSDEDVSIKPMVASSFRVVLVSNVVDATGGEVTIKNVKTYNLPDAGGCGYIIEILAVAMILCALIMYFLKKSGLNRNNG
jgi:hypothetical protein